MIHGGCSLHPAAWVHGMAYVEDATIGARTRVWQFASVIQGTVLGADCNVGATATLSGAIFGDGCRISSGVTIGPGFKVGHRVFLGPHVVFANDMYPSAEPAGFEAERLRAGQDFCVIVGDDAMIGAHAVLLPGVTVGRGALIAAGAVVHGVVPPDQIWHRDGHLSGLSMNWRQRRMRYAANPEEV